MDVNQLLKHYLDGERAFQGICLHQANLDQSNLSQIDLSQADLSG